MESQCLTCARTATVSLWKTTFGGSLEERPQGGGAQFVKRGNRTGFWSCELEKVLTRPTYLKAKFDQCVEIAGESARGWRRPGTF